MMRNKWNYIIVPLFIVILWEVLSIIFNRSFFPGAFNSIKALIILISDGTILPHLGASTYRIVSGTLLGLATAIPVGFFMGRNRIADKYLGTAFNILYPVPKVVFLPVIIVCMGIGDMPKIFLIALVLFFQLTVVIRDAAKNISKDLSQSMKSLGASRIQYMMHLVLPACLPDIITSVRSTFGVSTAMLFITENFASFKGLGYYITKCMDSRDYNNMYAAIIMLGLLGAGLYLSVGIAEKKICKWKILETTDREQNYEKSEY